MIAKLKRIVSGKVSELRIERDRAEGKFSQYDLARVLQERGHKIQQAQIGHIEAGRRLPSTEVLYSLAEIFDTSLDYLTGRTQTQTSIADIEEDLQTGGISGRLGELYKGLPLERQRELYQFAEALRILTLQENQKLGTTPLPTEQQRRRANVLAILESIDRNLGSEIRVEVEKLIRDRGHLSDLDT